MESQDTLPVVESKASANEAPVTSENAVADAVANKFASNFDADLFTTQRSTRLHVSHAKNRRAPKSEVEHDLENICDQRISVALRSKYADDVIISQARRASVENGTSVSLEHLNKLRSLYDKREQADEHDDLFTNEALIAREAIRLNKQIQGRLASLFLLVDENKNGQVDKNEYMLLNRKLYTCLKAFWDPNLPDLTEAELKTMGEEDWEEDLSHLPEGTKGIGAEAMGVSIFQLCDAWVQLIEQEAYKSWINKLMDMIMIYDNNLKRDRLATDEEIRIQSSKHLSWEKDLWQRLFKLYDHNLKRWEMTCEIVEMLHEHIPVESRAEPAVKQRSHEMLDFDSDLATDAILHFCNFHLKEVHELWKPIEEQVIQSRSKTKTTPGASTGSLIDYETATNVELGGEIHATENAESKQISSPRNKLNDARHLDAALNILNDTRQLGLAQSHSDPGLLGPATIAALPTGDSEAALGASSATTVSAKTDLVELELAFVQAGGHKTLQGNTSKKVKDKAPPNRKGSLQVLLQQHHHQQLNKSR